MKIQNLLLLLFALVIFSCGDDTPDECVTVNYSAEFSEEIDAVTAATVDYSSDPTTDNCNALQNAYSDYIDEIEKFEDCAREAGQLEEWQALIDQARADLQDIC